MTCCHYDDPNWVIESCQKHYLAHKHGPQLLMVAKNIVAAFGVEYGDMTSGQVEELVSELRAVIERAEGK